MKKKYLWRLLSLVLFSSVSCMRMPNIDITRSKEYREDVYLNDKNQLYYFGGLEAQKNEKIFELYENAEVKPITLFIMSQGGDVFLGMELAEFVFDNQLNVEVNQFCLSSCANYIFTAAKSKFIQPESVLAWHGSSWQSDINQKFLEKEDWAIKWRNREIEFYNKIGVNPQITVKGFEQYKFKNRLKAIISRKPILGFNYSIEDMKFFGVDNVYLTDRVWNWEKANKCCNIVRVKAELSL